MRTGLFLCMRCASLVGDEVVIDMATEVDQGSTPQQAFEVVVSTIEE